MSTTPTAELLADLIQDRMSLEDVQVLLYNQKVKLPGTKGLMVCVSLVGDRVFSVNSKQEDTGVPEEDLDETITVNKQEVIQIDVYSYDESAINRRNEILFALASVTAQQLCEVESMQIGRIPPSFVDASEVEASKRLNRFAITFNVLRAYSETKSVQTFAEFSQPQLYSNP